MHKRARATPWSREDIVRLFYGRDSRLQRLSEDRAQAGGALSTGRARGTGRSQFETALQTGAITCVGPAGSICMSASTTTPASATPRSRPTSASTPPWASSSRLRTLPDRWHHRAGLCFPRAFVFPHHFTLTSSQSKYSASVSAVGREVMMKTARKPSVKKGSPVKFLRGAERLTAPTPRTNPVLATCCE